jgi:two-component system response regulator HydG/two-component system response regulator AtoC
VNCAALPESLLESELFGFERGAFTGAHTSQEGKLEAGDGGTVFLDEIGELSPPAQAKILRALETREVYRLGAKRPVQLDVRFVAATNRDLESLVSFQGFRADLFYRLNVARLRMPALRERRQDIPLLIAHFIEDLNSRFGKALSAFTATAKRRLMSYDWPGNVRELRNIVEASFVHLPFPGMKFLELPDEFNSTLPPADAPPEELQRPVSALSSHKWNKSQAARELHWSRMTLYRKMAKYQLTPRAT